MSNTGRISDEKEVDEFLSQRLCLQARRMLHNPQTTSAAERLLTAHAQGLNWQRVEVCTTTAYQETSASVAFVLNVPRICCGVAEVMDIGLGWMKDAACSTCLTTTLSLEL